MKLYVNGSPKLENGNSNYFLNKIKDKEKIKCVYRDRFSDILIKTIMLKIQQNIKQDYYQLKQYLNQIIYHYQIHYQ